ncbi:MAG: hypothetical protein PVJ84_09385, partial [Desulfobacteraceae bacterium]
GVPTWTMSSRSTKTLLRLDPDRIAQEARGVACAAPGRTFTCLPMKFDHYLVGLQNCRVFD